MLLLLLISISFFSHNSYSQISDASFFPSMKSINPGVAHMRRHGFVALDLSKKDVERNHDVPLGGIVGGIKTEVDLKKGTLFRAGKGPGITFELLFDKEIGEKVETINSTTFGKRVTSNEASSTYAGGILDLKYIGISYGRANYKYLNEFRIGEPPNVSAKDVNERLDYNNIKIGSAIKIGPLRLGAFMQSLKSSGEFAYTFYDPTTGNKGTTEKYPVTTSSNGYGVGLGFSGDNFRIESSLERMYGNSLNISKDYPGEAHTPPPASRVGMVAEMKFTKIAFGVRVRQIKGNYTDLEDLISSNLLYGNLEADDTRLETTFNFGFGISKGFSFSGFYTQSKVSSEEKSPVFDNGLKYDALTISKAIGINVSYVY